MIIKQTDIYTKWFEKLKDVRLIARIQVRLKKLAKENYFGEIGQIKPASCGVSEMIFHYGAGYRIYSQAGLIPRPLGRLEIT